MLIACFYQSSPIPLSDSDLDFLSWLQCPRIADPIILSHPHDDGLQVLVSAVPLAEGPEAVTRVDHVLKGEVIRWLGFDPFPPDGARSQDARSDKGRGDDGRFYSCTHFSHPRDFHAVKDSCCRSSEQPFKSLDASVLAF